MSYEGIGQMYPMSSSEEMYQRGAQDAVHDDLNPFYYQHYYYYRRGYNDTRRQLRQTSVTTSSFLGRQQFAVLLGVLMIIGTVAGVSMFLNRRGEEMLSDTQPAIAAQVRPPAAVASRVPVAAAQPAPTSAPAPLMLQVGATALVVNLGESSLRVRVEPGINQPVAVRLPDNTEVTILEGPVEADGYTWWRIEGETGSGWSAERSLDGVVWLDPR